MKKILKPIIIMILIVVVLCSVAMGVIYMITGGIRLNPLKIGDKIAPVSSNADDEELIDYTKAIMQSIKEADYNSLASVVHSEYGVIFSPYATVNLATDRCFSRVQVASFETDTKKYIWGVYDGSGEPIELTPKEYVAEFVFDEDFTKCKQFGIDEIIRSGNALENVEEVFSGARYVDCYMPDPTGASGTNWRSLRFVFEEYKGELVLTAIIHSENTI